MSLKFVVEQYEIHSRDVYLEGDTVAEAVADYLSGRRKAYTRSTATMFVACDDSHGCTEDDTDSVLAELVCQVRDREPQLVPGDMLPSIVAVYRLAFVLRSTATGPTQYWDSSRRLWGCESEATLYDNPADLCNPPEGAYYWVQLKVRVDDPRWGDAGQANPQSPGHTALAVRTAVCGHLAERLKQMSVEDRQQLIALLQADSADNRDKAAHILYGE